MKCTYTSIQTLAYSVILLFCTFVAAGRVVAQSGDPKFPTPIHSSNLSGKISARDLGDARLTNHYYAFKGTPGDLLITVNSRNLNGDIDVFTATTLRPLLKIALYAESTGPVTKGVFLRRSEDLVLRIEARSPNDDAGTYQLFFGGSFQAIAGGEDIEENVTASPEVATTPSPGARRASSVGARIVEPTPPVTEVAAAPTPEPTPEPSPAESPTPVIVERPAETEAPKVTPPRSSRSRRPAGRRTTTPTTRPAEEAKTEAPTTPEAEPKTEAPTTAEVEPKPKTPARGSSRRAAETAKATKPPPEPEPDSGPRLIIETNDGTLINRAMSRVRRVTVENGQVVVLNRDGTTNRILLANVVKMAIQP